MLGIEWCSALFGKWRDPELRPFWNRRAILIGSFAALLVAGGRASGDGIEGIGHYDDTAWSNFDAEGGYDDIAVDIRVDATTGAGPSRQDGRDDAYYYSNYATFTHGEGAYGGLQTNGFDGKNWVGKMLIFSIWNATDGLAEPGGTKTKFDGEGIGYSVRLPYDWSLGTTYRFRMYLDRSTRQEGNGRRLWAASLTDLDSGQTVRIGRIFAPASFGKIRTPITFHERYLGATPSCSAISPSRVRFTNMTANGGAIKAGSFEHRGTKSLPQCQASSGVQDRADGYVSWVKGRR